MDVISPLVDMRRKADMVKIFSEEMSMEDLFGLNEPAIVRILETVTWLPQRS